VYAVKPIHESLSSFTYELR